LHFSERLSAGAPLDEVEQERARSPALIAGDKEAMTAGGAGFGEGLKRFHGDRMPREHKENN